MLKYCISCNLSVSQEINKYCDMITVFCICNTLSLHKFQTLFLTVAMNTEMLTLAMP
jgi:hypothetical protein